MDTKNSNNNHRLGICLMVLLLAFLGGPVAGDPEVEAIAPGGSSLLTLTTEQAARLSPMLQQMREILIREKDQLEILYTEFAQETDSQRALEIQWRIRNVKTDAQIELLEVQAVTARAQGRVEDAERLERVIESMKEREVTRDQGAG